MYNIHVMMNTNDRNLFAIFSLGQEDIAYIFDKGNIYSKKFTLIVIF